MGNLRESLEPLATISSDQWLSKIEAILEKGDALGFAENARTLLSTYYTRERKRDPKVVKVSGILALAAGVGYWEAGRRINAAGMATLLRDQFPQHAAGPILAELLTRDREKDFSQTASQYFSAGARSLYYLELFDGFPPTEVEQLLRDVKLKTVVAGERIMSAGDKPDRFFIILSGAVAVKLESGAIHVLKDQDCFGEIAMLLSQKEVRANVDATVQTELLEFSKAQLIDAFVKFPDLESRILRFAFLRSFWNLAADIPGLKNYKAKDLTEFFEAFSPEHYRKGEVLFRKGSVASGFYLIISGEVQVRYESKEVATLKPGEFVGEISLLHSGKHCLEATAFTAVHALVCAPEKFGMMIKKFPAFFAFISEIASLRERELQQLQFAR